MAKKSKVKLNLLKLFKTFTFTKILELFIARCNSIQTVIIEGKKKSKLPLVEYFCAKCGWDQM